MHGVSVRTVEAIQRDASRSTVDCADGHGTTEKTQWQLIRMLKLCTTPPQLVCLHIRWTLLRNVAFFVTRWTPQRDLHLSVIAPEQQSMAIDAAVSMTTAELSLHPRVLYIYLDDLRDARIEGGGLAQARKSGYSG